MAAFDFPASPTNGQTYSLNGTVFTYNGYGWVQQGNSGGVNTAYVDAADALKVAKSGDVMTGPLTLVGPCHWTFGGVGSGSWYSTIGIVDRFFVGSDALADGWRIYAAGAAKNALYIDGMSGLIDVAGAPQTPSGIATKQYTDTKVAKTGDTMTGDLAISKSVPQIAVVGADYPRIVINKTDASGNVIQGMKNGVERWQIRVGDTGLEVDPQTGSNFALSRYTNAGAYLDDPLYISRANGSAVFNVGPVTHGKGTDYGTGAVRFKWIPPSNGLLWDLNLNDANRLVWDTGNSAAAGISNGYQKFGSGIILQWGSVINGGENMFVAFPMVFPNNSLNIMATMNSTVATNILLTAHINSNGNSGFNISTRYNTSGTIGTATQSFFWYAVGW